MIKQRSNLTLPVSLYAIGGVKDELNLHTGELTHRIGKIELTGTEIWLLYNDNYYSSVIDSTSKENRECVCSHLRNSAIYVSKSSTRLKVYSKWVTDVASTVYEWKQFIMDEYAAGHPVTVWYILETPTTEIITVPEGLSGIVEGYLIQDGTPTPTNPIYPSSCDSVDMWNEIMYRQYGVNETLSPIPSTVFSQGDGIDSCTVYGNTVQNGTPTPTDPVDVNGVGVMSENLFDKTDTSQIFINTSMALAGWWQFSSGGVGIVIRIPCEKNTTYTLACDIVTSVWRLSLTDVTDAPTDTAAVVTNDIVREKPLSGVYSFTTTSNTKYILFQVSASVIEQACDIIMLNKGSTPLPYEPYGYVVPIEVDNTKITVPLNTTQSIRQIGKIIFDGTESIDLYEGKFYTKILDGINIRLAPYSSHYIGHDGTTADMPINSVKQVAVKLWGETPIPAFIFYNEYTRTVDFKAYLQQQYANGTPVTVYYVLAEPQTTTLNQPLMKIGDYADSVTYSSNIPTTYGQNDITTDTQIKPSKLDITYNALRRAKVYKNDRWILNPSIDWSQTLKISDLQSKKIKEMEGEYIGYNIHT